MTIPGNDMLHIVLFMRNLLYFHPLFIQIRLLYKLIAVMLWIFLGAPPAVRAFRPSTGIPAGVRGVAGKFSAPPFTVTSSFRFPTVPLRDAVQYIHTPEHLETSLPLQPLAATQDYFRIRRVSQPIRYGEYVTVSLDCLIRSVPHTLVMLSRSDQNHTCTYMCFHDGFRLGEIHLSVRQNNKFPSSQGHILSMQTTYFSKSRRLIDSYLQPTVGFITHFENATHVGQKDALKPHANLQWYRRMILGLPGTPDRWL